MFNKKTIFISGGSGSWGQELTQQLLEGYDVAQIRIFSRGEHAQVKMRQRFDNSQKLKFYIGDVRDSTRVHDAMKGADYVFHLAALKHVPVVEHNPWESVLTNIYGTQNVINSARQHGVEKMIFVSTDKAVDPLNLYGVTKACAERLVTNANDDLSPTRFLCFRAGNVIGTNGSVVPLFHEQIQQANVITITDERMTRFFVTKSSVVKELIEASVRGVGGEIMVPRMKALMIKDLAETMIKALGDAQTQAKVIGLRPGEKMLEHLISRNEVSRTYERDQGYVILPFFPSKALQEAYEVGQRVSFEECHSDNVPKVSPQEIHAMLKAEGWLEKSKRPGEGSVNSLEVFKKEGWQPS